MVVLTSVAIAMILALGLLPIPELLLPVVGLVGGLALGASRTPRDVMLKDAAPPGQIGKVFGFVSSGPAAGRRDHAGAARLRHRHGLPAAGAAGGGGAAGAVAAVRGSAQAEARSRAAARRRRPNEARRAGVTYFDDLLAALTWAAVAVLAVAGALAPRASSSTPWASS